MTRLTTRMRQYAGQTTGVLTAFSALGLAFYAPIPPNQPIISAVDLLTTAPTSALIRTLLGGVLAWQLSRFTLPQLTVRQLRYAGTLALLFAACCCIGSSLQCHGKLPTEIIEWMLLIPEWQGLFSFFLVFLLAAIHFAGRILAKWRATPTQNFSSDIKPSHFKKSIPIHILRLNFHSTSRRSCLLRFLFLHAGIFICWLPVWLAYYPGLANYDILSHMMQCASGQYSTLHPVLYTLLLQCCLQLSSLFHGDTTLAIALLCLGQMLLLSGAMAWSLSTLLRHGASLLPCLLIGLFFALFPVFPLLAVSTTKDVPYAALALIVMILLFEFSHDPSRFFRTPAKIFTFLLSSTFMCMLRYNGIVSLSLLIPVLLFLLRWKPASSSNKHRVPKGRRSSPPLRLRMVFLLLSSMLLAWLGTQWLNQLTNAAPSFVTARDVASVPSQQMVRAVLEMEHNSPEYQDVVQWYSGASMIHRYRPCLADYTKRYINVDHSDGWRGFARTWLKTGLNHSRAYIEAFLEQTRGLWFIHDLSHAQIYPKNTPLFGYLLNNQVDCSEYISPIRFSSKLPGLQDFLNRLTTENTYQKLPGIRLLFSIGAQCWLSILLFAAALYRRQKATALAMAWLLCQILVLAFAPAVLVRYVLPIFLGNAAGVGLLIVQPKRFVFPSSTSPEPAQSK